MHETAYIRPSAVDGLFYPGKPDDLRSEVRNLVARAASAPVDGEIKGLIVPHAGFAYSGFTAAHGYSLLTDHRFDAVMVVAPSHREYFDGVSVFSGKSYLTPLGEIEIDQELRHELLSESRCIEASTRGHAEEHAVEVQLPFLQETLGKFTLVPLVLGDQKRELCLELGRAVAHAVTGKDVLLIASTDLSHYHRTDDADRLDSVMIDDIQKFDYEGLLSHLEMGKTEACGGGPTVSVLAALTRLGVGNIRVLHQCNSGDITGETDRVVGYCAAVAYA